MIMQITNKEVQKIVNNIPLTAEMQKYSLVISGTFLLSIYGLMNEYGDIDIIVQDMDEDFYEYLCIWAEDNNIEYEKIGEEDNYYSTKIEHNGITYNFIDGSNFPMDNNYISLSIENKDRYKFMLDYLHHAMTAKMGLKRSKDYQHQIKIANKILNF